MMKVLSVLFFLWALLLADSSPSPPAASSLPSSAAAEVSSSSSSLDEVLGNDGNEVSPGGVTALAAPSFSPEEEEHISSVTVRMYCREGGQEGEVVYMYYTLDGSTPTLSSSFVTSGESIIIDTIGTTTINAFSYIPPPSSSSSSSISPSAGMATGGGRSSSLSSKKYAILSRVLPPLLLPAGGTFAGTVEITLSSSTPASSIIFTTDGSPPRRDNPNSHVVPSPGAYSLMSSGSLTAVAVKEGYAPSAEKREVFVILPKVATPTIQPDKTVFTVSATLSITCSTPNATIYYTTDGSHPTLSSYRLDPLDPQLVLDTAGTHVVTAFAASDSMLQSDVVERTLTILPRAASPVMDPPAGTFIEKVSVCFTCSVNPSASPLSVGGGGSDKALDNNNNNDISSATVYYTLDGHSTPSLQSPHLPCGGCVLLSGPSSVVRLRAFVAEDQKSPSSLVTAEYNIVRPAYDEFPVNPNALLQLRPDVDIFVVEKNLPYASYPKSSYCGKRNIRGRLIVLHNPIGHFDVVEPEYGCGGGLSLPSVSGRKSWTRAAKRKAATDSSASGLPRYESYYSAEQVESLSKEDVSVWKENFEKVTEDFGCEVVTNAGFFNVSNGACFGDVVSAGTIVQTSDKHNVNFGIRGGKFVTGYVTKDEVTGANMEEDKDHVAFDTLVSGLGWLVRGGESYVEESFHRLRPPAHPTSSDASSPILSSTYGEDMSAQSSGDSFPTLLSARTALGHDKEGRLLLLQVEGESWVRGMSLSEFAAFARELGFQSAINLDGGGSATMTANHSLISEPSWQCSGDDFNTTGRPVYHPPQERTYCEKAVSSITCIHSMPPPLRHTDSSSSDTPQKTTTITTSSPSAASPTVGGEDTTNPSGSNTTSPPCEVSPRNPFAARMESLENELRGAKASKGMYKSISLALVLVIFIFVLVQLGFFFRNSGKSHVRDDNTFQWDSPRYSPDASVEMSRNLQGEYDGIGDKRGLRPRDIEEGSMSSRHVQPQQGRRFSPPSTPPVSNARNYPQDNSVGEEMALEDYGLSDTLDFHGEFDSSDEGDADGGGGEVRFKKPSDMAYINKPVNHDVEQDLDLADDKDLEEEEDIDIEQEEQTSLLSPPPSLEKNTRKKKSKEKKSKDKKRSKKMSMNFSDRSL